MPNTNCLNLFVYGTLMDRDELAYDLVLPRSEVDRRFRLRVAEAPGFRRVYNKVVPEWGGAVLNMIFDKEDKEISVVGMLIMDMTNQELGMLDASFPTHLPRKPVEVLLEGEKVAAIAYLAKEVDADAEVSPKYERRMKELVEQLGDPIRSNFQQHTYRADGSPCYREAPPPVPEPQEAPAGDAAPDTPSQEG